MSTNNIKWIEEGLTYLNYSHRNSKDIHAISDSIDEEYARNRLNSIHNLFRKRVSKKKNKYIWNAPDKLYSLIILDENIDFRYKIIEFKKEKCIDNVFQAYMYKFEQDPMKGLKTVLLYDDVNYGEHDMDYLFHPCVDKNHLCEMIDMFIIKKK